MGYLWCETNGLPEGGKPKAVAKMQMKSKQSTIAERHQPTTQPKEAPTVRRSVELDSNQTDVDDDPTPMKSRGALKRSFAVANVDEISATADAQKRRSKYGETFSDDEYEIATGPEKNLVMGTSEPASLSSDSFDDDDDPTPKKRSRKLSLREAVGASRKEPEPRREQMKVCILPQPCEGTDLKHVFSQICDKTTCARLLFYSYAVTK
jgi:hypothetical protein